MHETDKKRQFFKVSISLRFLTQTSRKVKYESIEKIPHNDKWVKILFIPFFFLFNKILATSCNSFFFPLLFYDMWIIFSFCLITALSALLPHLFEVVGGCFRLIGEVHHREMNQKRALSRQDMRVWWLERKQMNQERDGKQILELLL